VPLVAGLMQVTSDEERRVFLEQDSKSMWRTEYAHGIRHQVYGFKIGLSSSGEPFAGLCFAEIAAKIYEESGEKVMLIAAQTSGRLMINFPGELEEGQVVLAIAPSFKNIKPFADLSTDWRQTFLARRMEMLKREQLEFEDQFAETGTAAELEVGSASVTVSNDSLQELHMTRTSKSIPVVETERQSRSRDVEHFKNLLQSPGLVVLIVAEGNEASWEEVDMFIGGLRQEYLSFVQQPIIVLSPTRVPPHLRHRYEHQSCAFVSGKVLDSMTLRMAGIDVAEAVITLRGGTWEGFDAAHIVMEDYEVITLTNLISKIWTRMGKRNGYALYEFGSTLAVELRELRNSERQHADADEEQGRLPKQDAANTLLKRIVPRFCPTNASSEELCSSWSGSSKSAYLHTISRQLLLLPSFAAGQVFSPDFFGSVLGHIYNFPATIEFIETICMPQYNHQSSFSWQVRCPPKWVKRTFGELVRSWANGQDDSDLLKESGPVLVLALYRSHRAIEGKGTPHEQGYQVTLPPASTVLNESDLITLLGTPAFGKSASEHSLLGASSIPEAPRLPPGDLGPSPSVGGAGTTAPPQESAVL